MSGLLKPVIFCLFLFLSQRILLRGIALAENTTFIPVNIGVVVDYEFEKWVGKIRLSCINMSLTDHYAKNSHYKTRLVLHIRDSKDSVLGAASAALDLLKDVEVQAILGPTTSMQAIFLSELGEKAQVPVVSFSASTPSLSSMKSPYFFQATQNDKTQVKAIGAIVQAFGWRAVVPIYMDNEYGVGIIPYLMESLQQINIHIPYKAAISPSATDDEILHELHKLMKMRTRVFVLHMYPSLGSQLLKKAKEIGMMNEGYVWILTDGMTNFMSSMDPLVLDSMQGVVGVKPYVPKTKDLEYFGVQLKMKFHQDYLDMVDAELNVYGQWAYDAAMALAMAIETAASSTKSFDFRGPKFSGYATDFETIRVSRAGPDILQALANTSFKGLSGDFHFVNRQLHPSQVFEIVNLHGEKPKSIGFWTPGKGLVKKLNSTSSSSSTSDTGKGSLATIIWPGDSTTIPIGTGESQENLIRLSIGVPIYSFKEFVNVTKDPSSDNVMIKGFSIETFDAVMQELPYAVRYEYIPFVNPNGSVPAGTHDDLVYQVYLGNFDAVVGDTTITANRSIYVDFTLPYLRSDVSMLVLVEDNKNNNALMFLRPLSPALWATTFSFFLFIAFVIWALEHRINDEFRGSPSHQAGTSLWFAFSTMVFAHREKVINNLARVVIIVWSFVLLILTQSYTASFSSLLTVNQFHPAVTDVRELIQNQEFVGYFSNSFVFDILIGLGFQESYMKAYASSKECDRLLSLGSKNGGIAAAFDESAYMKLILARSCSNYTLVEAETFMSKIPYPNIQQFKTGGFSFVFRRDSPLVADVSRAILKVAEKNGRKQKDGWIGDERSCPGSVSYISSSVLGLDSFWGLFLIAGVVSFSALLIYTVMFVHAHREILNSSSSEASALSRILHLLRTFDQKDPRADAFREKEVKGERAVDFRGDDYARNGLSNIPVQEILPRDQLAGATYEDQDANTDVHSTPSQEIAQLNIEVANCHVNEDPNRQTSQEILAAPSIQLTSTNNG